MKTINNKIVYEVGDWVTRVASAHLNMEIGDTDKIININHPNGFKLYKYDSSEMSAHNPKNLRPET